MKKRMMSLLCIFVFCLSMFSISAMAESIPLESEDVVQSELDARIEQDTAFRNQIVQLYKDKEYDEAINQAEAFLEDNPDSPVAEKFVKTCIYSYVGKAKLLRDSRQREAALELLDTCIERYEDSVDIQYAIDARTALKKLIKDETPANGHVFHNTTVVRGGYGTLKVKSGSYPVLVKVEVASGAHKGEYINLFVRAKSTASVHIQPGKYLVKYCVGETWYGPGEWFGSEMERYQCDTTLEFAKLPYYSTWELTLYSVVDGNLSTYPISADDF